MSYSFRRRRRRSDHGVDDWLMTYADMITLLICFFAIFLSVSVPKKEQMDEARKKVMEHFASPDVSKGKMIPKDDMIGNPQDVLPYEFLPSIVDKFHSGEGLKGRDGRESGREKNEFRNDGQAERDLTNRGENAFDKKKDKDHDKEGDRIVSLEMPSAAFFSSGSASLSMDGAALLVKIMNEQLNAPEFKDYIITVEGHTDDEPIKTLQFPSNWELSTARAAAVVRFLIQQGMPPARLRAAGYSDVFPKVANRDENGKAIPDNQAKNRRVVLKLEKIEKSGVQE